MIRPTALGVATVDLDAYRHNLARITRQVAPAELMVMVKGNAYGHGLLPIAWTAVAEGIRRIGVLETATGLELRRQGIDRSVSLFAWLLAPDEDYRAAIDAGIDLGISQPAQLRAIAECGADERARLHLKIDTGLHRNGATEADWPQLVREAVDLERTGNAEVYGVWTHIAETSDEDDTVAIHRFETAVSVAEKLGARFTRRHVAASAAGFARADSRFDLVRMGAFSYGISPGGGVTPDDLGLIPVLTLSAPVSQVVRTDGGWFATVPLGWAHGIPSDAPGVVPVTIDGRRYPIVGRVEQNQFVTAVDREVRTGDSVVIFGRVERGELTLQHWADALGTIGEELAVRIAASVPRRYLGAGQLASVKANIPVGS